MKRRRFLSTVSIGSVAAIAGCVGGENENDPIIAERMTVETRHWNSDALEDGLYYRQEEARRRNDDHLGHYWTIIADQETAVDREREDITNSFIQETDFTESYVLIVQYGMTSAQWLGLTAIERTERGLRVAITTHEPDRLYGDDWTVHSLAIRITDETVDVPNDIIVLLDGERTAT